MSAPLQLPAAIETRSSGPTHSRLVRRARMLALLSVAWMTVEGGVAITAAIVAGSVALLAFGLDSLIELVSAATILWLYTGRRGGSEAAERRAQGLVALCFAALALYVTFDAIDALARGSRPDTSWPGVTVTAAAIIVMPLLARAKQRVAEGLGSAATADDAAQSWLCLLGAMGALAGVLATAALGWWWLDPIAGIAIAGLAAREGRETWAGQGCGHCAPTAVAPHERRAHDCC